LSQGQTFNELLKQLRPAGFGGVPFGVDSTTEDYGHRIAIHEFPNSDFHTSESLGAKARKISIDGYIVGKGWQRRRDSLIKAAEGGSPRLLQHPFYKKLILAKAISLNINHDKEELGIVRFSLELVEEISVSISPFSFILSLLQGALDDVISGAAGSWASTYLGNLAYIAVKDTVVSGVERWAAGIDGARAVTVFDSSAASASSVSGSTGASSSSVTGLSSTVGISSSGGAAVASGEAPSFSSVSLSQTNETATSTPSAATEVASAITRLYTAAVSIAEGADPTPYINDIIGAFRSSDADPADLARSLEPLLWDGVDLKEKPKTVTLASGEVRYLSDTEIAERKVTIEIDRLFRRAFGGLWLESVVQSSFGSRADAVTSRNLAVKWMESEVTLINPNNEDWFYEVFDRLRTRVIRDFNDNWTNAAPVRTQSFSERGSMLAIATALYGDPTRAIEIWERNLTTSPSQIGPEIEFLAR
jgi:prophage DNA circulation protein